jgi:hypothetical protein
MRKWLVEETGEVRCPRKRESFLGGYGIDTASIDYAASKLPILRVTEISPDDIVINGLNWHNWPLESQHPLSDRLDEWNW